jgi:hypothetical protein
VPLVRPVAVPVSV